MAPDGGTPEESEDDLRAGMEIRIRFPSDPFAVRSALGGVLEGLAYCDLDEDVCGTLELVLAEALNNVVEHAHAGRGDGMIEVRVLHHRTDQAPILTCELIDDGAPMPTGEMPAAREPEIGETAALPEGGFGWLLIRELAKDVDYERRGDCNWLRFRLDAATSPPQDVAAG